MSHSKTPTSIHDMGLTKEQLKAELEALRASQKKLERLSEIEGDLMLLLDELARQPKIKERPDGCRPELSSETVEPDEFFVPAQNNQPLVIAKKPKSNQSPPEAASPSPQHTEGIARDSGGPSQTGDQQTIPSHNPGTAYSFTSSDYVLWLGFFVSEKAADAGSMRLQKKINFQRMGLNIEVVGNANTRGQYYGLVLGPFKTLQQANSFCSALAKHGQYCQVRPNSWQAG